MYIKRHAEATVRRLAKMFGAVLVAGPRQVGKTTMLERVASGIRRVSMDDAILRASAEERTHTFFLDNPPPVFVDEIQKAPLLFEEIKLWLDKERKKGQFYMCGSQQFRMMKGVSESLAGRIGLITLLGLSIRERKGVSFDSPFTPTEEYLKAREKELVPIPYSEVWDMVHRGSMPELVDNEDFDWRLFYGSYVSTYIERDVRELSEIGDEVKFSKFMVALASSIGQLLNLASLARDVGISLPTAERWMSILVASNLVYLLRPYSSNLLKRAIKTPKVYFLDTGLAAYLTKWTTPAVLQDGAMAGHFFENFVVAEIIKTYCNQGILEPPIYFYRDKDMYEIDLLIEDGDRLHPVEIKKHADPRASDIASFRKLDEIPGKKRAKGALVCLYDKVVSLSESDKAVPISYL